MQAICREELNHVLKAHLCDKVDDMCVTKALINHNKNNSLAHASGVDKSETEQMHGFTVALLQQNIKVDESSAIDLFPTHATTWQQNPMNSQEYAHLRLDLSSTSKLLLQSSDDPLICRGADDAHDEDHPLEFKTVIAKKNRQQQQQQQQHHHHHHHQQQRLSYQAELKVQPKGHTTSGCSTLTKQQLKAKANQMSAQSKNQHSNTSMSTMTLEQATQKSLKKNAIKLRFHHQALPPEYRQHDANHGQQQQHVLRSGANTRKSGSIERSTTSAFQAAVTRPRPPSKNAQENVRSWLQKIAEIQRAAEQQKQQEQKRDVNNNSNTYQTTDTIHNTTSANCQTIRRHHKIAPTTTTTTELEANEHVLKYSNLPYMGEITLHNSKPRRGRKPKKADICHLIYKNYGTIVPGATIKDKHVANANVSTLQKFKKCNLGKEIDDNEPLNLCLRDQSTDSFSISSSDECEKYDPTKKNLSCSTPLNSTGHACNATSTTQAHESKESVNLAQISTDADTSATSLIQHSISLYYQNLFESGILLQEDGQTLRIPIETIEKDNQLALKIPIPNGLFPAPVKVVKPPISPSISTTSTEMASTTVSLKSESSLPPATNLHIQLVPPKRKRSAIFIPPMPAENSLNPPTEVSICKFKFTGGAKPTLQEKKMLSVDADGNYRFYNGCAEKVNYECLPREHVGPAVLPPPNTNLYNGVSEKIFVDIPPPSADLSHELLQIPPESPTSVLLQPVSTMLLPQSPLRTYPMSQSPKSSKLNLIETSAQVKIPTTERKRKFRRSTQREKFEKNFSEKGFLIQTQQLESAEGSTYCKFRQLKKFTRYLFRNWKDYLPNGELNNRHAAHAHSDQKTNGHILDQLGGMDKATMSIEQKYTS